MSYLKFWDYHLLYFNEILITVYSYKEIANKDCKAYQYETFTQIEEAKEACSNDEKCASVFDVGCSDEKTYHLCTSLSYVLLDSMSNDCTHDKLIIGKFLT